MNSSYRSIYLAAALVAALTACNKTETSANNMAAANDMNAADNAAMTGSLGNTVSQVDSDFVTSSIKSDTSEIAIGELAASKGSTKAVKDFGNMLMSDHGAHKQKLVDLANSAGVPVPQEPADEGHANLLKLQKLSGTEFDKTFAQMLVDSHHKGIAKNEKQAQSGDPQTAQLAKDSLPVLKKHLATAESLAK